MIAFIKHAMKVSHFSFIPTCLTSLIKYGHSYQILYVKHINILLQKDRYTKVFKDNGYDNTMLISGMTEKELKDIGIKTKGTKQKLLQDIQLLPNYEIIAEVPVSTFQICLTICMLLLGIFILAHWIMISEILLWDRKSYLTNAILPRLSREGYINWLY